MFATAEWMIVRNTSLGDCYKGCFPLSLIRVSSAGGLRPASISSSSAASRALISTIAVCLCSVQPTTYSIDWLFFNIYRGFIYPSCLALYQWTCSLCSRWQAKLAAFLGCIFCLFVCVATSYSHAKMGEMFGATVFFTMENANVNF